MDVQQAIEQARTHLLTLFQQENPTNVGLEEVEFDEKQKAWDITFGFSRPWEIARTALSLSTRTYKVIRVSDADGKVLAVTNRASLI